MKETVPSVVPGAQLTAAFALACEVHADQVRKGTSIPYVSHLMGVAAYTNENRDWRIYADFAQVLIQEARSLYIHDSFAVELEQTAYALDSTLIDLCLSLFPWAQFRKRKGAVKLHTLLDLRGNIPTLIIITHGKIHDVNILDELPLEAGAIYILDRGYLDFGRLYTIHRASPFSSLGPKAISISNVSILNPSRKSRVYKPIRLSRFKAFMPRKIIPKNYGGFVTSRGRTTNGLYS